MTADKYSLAPEHQANTIAQQIESFRFQRHLETVKLAVLDGLPNELRTDSWQAERDAVTATIGRQENAIDTLLGLAEGLPAVANRKPA